MTSRNNVPSTTGRWTSGDETALGPDCGPFASIEWQRTWRISPLRRFLFVTCGRSSISPLLGTPDSPYCRVSRSLYRPSRSRKVLADDSPAFWSYPSTSASALASASTAINHSSAPALRPIPGRARSGLEFGHQRFSQPLGSLEARLARLRAVVAARHCQSIPATAATRAIAKNVPAPPRPCASDELAGVIAPRPLPRQNRPPGQVAAEVLGEIRHRGVPVRRLLPQNLRDGRPRSDAGVLQPCWALPPSSLRIRYMSF